MRLHFLVSSSSLTLFFLFYFSLFVFTDPHPRSLHIPVHGRVSGCLLCWFDPADLSWSMQFGNGHLRLGIVSCFCWGCIPLRRACHLDSNGHC
jgi:hypothetical protein